MLRLTPLQNNNQNMQFIYSMIQKKATTTKLGEPFAENKGIDQPAHQKNATKTKIQGVSTSSVYSEDSFGGMCKPCDNIYVNTFDKMRFLPTAV